MREPTAPVPVRSLAFGSFPAWDQVFQARLAPCYRGSFVDLAGVRLDDFDAVVPLIVDHYAPLRRRPDLLGRKFFLPSAAAATLCDDKFELAAFLARAGFGDHVPPFRASGPPYPYVWKRRWGGFGEACHVIAGPADASGLDLGDPDWFAQAHVPGAVEYATHVLRVGGAVRYASTCIYEMAAGDLVKGARHWPHTTRMVRGCPWLGLFEAMLGRLDYEGTACIDFKVVDGRPQVFEINCRFGGSLKWDLNAYLDAYLAALAP